MGKIGKGAFFLGFSGDCRVMRVCVGKGGMPWFYRGAAVGCMASNGGATAREGLIR